MKKSKQNEALILVLALLITGGILGAGYWLFSRSNPETNPISNSNSVPSPNPAKINQDSTVIPSQLSQGEHVLFPVSGSPEKTAGVLAFAEQNYQQAVNNFEAILAEKRNDPETRVYLNNAEIGNQKSYQIAVALPIGTESTVALEILRGVAQAQTEINQKNGINGIPVKVILADDENDPTVAETVAITLSQNPEILGVVGHFSSGVTLIAGKIYNQNQLPMISATSTSTELSNAGNAVFRTVPSDRFTADKLAQYFLQDLSLKKAVIFFNGQSNYSRSLKDELMTAIYGDGGEVLEIFDVSLDNFDSFNAYDSIEEKKAEAIFLVPDSSTLEKTLKIVRVNRQKLPILAGDSVYQLNTLKVGEDGVGMVVAVPWHIQANRSDPFVQAADQLWGGDVNWRSAMAYDATQTLIAAMEKNPTRNGILTTLSSPSFSTPGATGTIRFLPSGDRNQAVELVTIQPGTRSGLGYDFVPIFNP